MPNTLSEPKPIEDEPHSNYPIRRWWHCSNKNMVHRWTISTI
jgi:hypothetical protein